MGQTALSYYVVKLGFKMIPYKYLCFEKVGHQKSKSSLRILRKLCLLCDLL